MTTNAFRSLSALTLLLAATAVAIRAQDDHDHAEHEHPATAAAHDDHDDHDDHDHDDHGAGDAHADEVTLTADAVRRLNLTFATVARRALVPSVVVPGRVAFDGDALAHVGAAVRGRVIDIRVRAGDAVAAGDELLTLESPELVQAQGELIQRRTAASVAESAVAPAREAYERARSLFDGSAGIALAEVQRRAAELRAAEGVLATAAAGVAVAESQLRLLGMTAADIARLATTTAVEPRYAVRAPIGGRVVEREVTPGEVVSPESDALLVIADLANVWVIADVPEAQLARVAVGADARVRLAASDEVIEGTVGHIAAAVDPAARTGSVRIVVPNPAGSLRPGMFARVELSMGGGAGGDATTRPDAQPLAVPAEAVHSFEGGTVVFVPVEGEPNTFAARRVTVDAPVGGYVAVRDGLAAGDRVVAAGGFILKADLGKSGAAHEH